MFRALILLVMMPGLAGAQSFSLDILQALKTAPYITESQWRELTAGNTVIYELDGQVFAYEQYLDDGSLFLIRTDDQSCQRGTWFMRGTAFCFNWEIERQVCFHHKRLGDAIYILELRNGIEINEYQRVIAIEPRPMQCGQDRLSALPAPPRAHA